MVSEIMRIIEGEGVDPEGPIKKIRVSVGEKVKVIKNINLKTTSVYTGEVVFENDHFFTVQGRSWRESFLKVDVYINHIKIIPGG